MSTTLKRRSLTVLGMVLLAAFLGVTFNRASAANPAPVMVFHLTEPEDDMLDAMNVINSDANSPMVTKVSIAISANGTLVYYDHWEDGFADDIANPTPSEIYSAGNLDGVQIWGNGLAADGCAPQIGSTIITCTNANDVLNKGNVIILDDDTIVVPNLSSTIDWDGKDKIGGSNAIAVTRSLWASGSNSLFAWGNAMYPTTEWGQVYTTPVGCDTINVAADMFEYVAFTITAAYDGTVIQTDPEGDGTWEANVTLNEGQTYFESTSTGGTCSYVKQGGKVRSNDPAKPIQVVLVTGDIAGSPGYGSRDLNLSPDAALSSSYWVPVGNNTGNGVDSQTPGTVRLYIYNPEATTMYVRCEKPSTATVYTIAADTVNTSFTLANDQAGHCFAVTGAASTTPDTSRKFTGVAAVDNDGTIWDWGVPFVPEDRLSNQALVGLGAGRDWTSNTNLNQNGSPIWVTPICSTFFYVDWNNDGTPDKVDFNGNNNVTDTNVNGLNETTSNTGFQVTTLQSVRMYDASDLDQTGAYVFTKTVANNGGVGGCNFAAAWGEDPRVASAASPGLDAGTIIVALRSVETSKDSVLLTDADSSGSLTPGDTLRYVITVENTGLAPVAVTVEDTIPTNTTYVANSTAKDVGSGFVAIPDNGSGTPFPLDNGGVALGNLPVGDTWQVRFSVTINSLPAGQTVDISNCAEITYDSSLVETCKVNTITVPAVPALTLDKTTTTAYYNAAGNTISYSYLVTNSGNVPVTAPYAVSDNKATVTCPQTPSPLAVGASITCTATYTVISADVTAGQVVNIATATAQYGGNPVTSNQDTVTVPLAALNVVKSSTTTTITAVGQVVPYTFTVTNTGNVALTGVTVSDPKCTSAISAPTGDTNSNGKLDLTETWVYSCTHTVTQAEMNAGGNLANTVTADSTETPPDTDPHTIPITQTPALSLDKDTTTTNYNAVGNVINYTYKVTNSGNISLTPPYAVSDNKTTATCNQTPNPLNPGDFFTCTATYTVTQADLNAGSVVNVASATAKNGANTVTSNTDTVTVPALQGPALTLDKDTSTPDYDTVGDTIQYTYKVTNSGNISLQPPYAVTDNKIGAPNTVVCQQLPSPLLPGQFFTCTATYTVTQADITAGSVTNIASATAMNGTNTVTSNQDTVTVPAVQTPALTLDKTTTTLNYNAVGNTISYSYKVTNSGNVPLTPPYAVSDNKATVTCNQTPNPLNPGDFFTCTATHTVTQADLDAGAVVNIATATAKYGNDTVTSNQDTVTVPAIQNPALSLDKDTTTTNYNAVGNVINYTYKVTNSGNVTLTPPYAVSDNKTTVTCNQTPNPLNPGDFFTCTASYTVTQADLNAGTVTNIATATAKHGNDTVTSNQDTVTVPAVQGPGLMLDKDTPTLNYAHVGDVIQYTYKVTNSGNVTLTPPYAVSDNKATVTCNQTPNPLDPGDFFTCTASYTVTQADLNAGTVTNIATATAKHGNDTVTSNQDTVTVPAVQTPGLSLDKDTPTLNYTHVGDVIQYTYKVTNSGNVTLTPPYAVADNKATVTCNQTPNPLNPGDFFTCTASYTVTQADITAGQVVNIATATAKHGNDTVTSNQDTVTVPAVQLPALTLDKTTTTTSYDSVGDPIVYSYKVTNSGNVPLTIPYAVNDDHITLPNTVNCPQTPNPLMPGQFITCTATYNVNQADITAGEVINVAQASAMYGSNPVLSNIDTVTVTMDRIPGLNVEKTTTTTLITAAGQMVDYRFAVTNSGNIPLTGVTVSDPMCDVGTLTGPTGDADNDSKLDLNETWVYTCIHTVTQAEMDSNGDGDGDLDNTVTADSAETDPDTDDLFIPIQQNPGLNVEKSSTTQLITHAGQPVTYTFDVTNTGNISLTGVTVSDPKCDAAPTGPTGDTNNDGKLGLLETWTFSCVHTVTQAEIDAATGPNPQLHNVVTADSNETGPDTDPLDIPIQYNPGLNVVKSSTTALITAAGQQVDYQFTVTNSGNVTLTNVTVSDPKCDALPVRISGDANNDGKMQVTEIWVFTCTHTVTLAEMNAGGNLHNVVTADSTETPPDTDDLDIPIQQSPALTLDKDTTTVNYDGVGDTIAYTYKVTNSGNVSLTPPYAVTDNKIGAPNTVTCQQTPNPLNPGDFFTCTATYTVTQNDLDAGAVTNIASGSAMHGQTPVISNTDTVTVPAIQTPLLEVTKTPNKTVVASGDLVTFTILVENKGTITLSLNSLIDSVYGDITTTGHNGITATTCDVTPPVTLAALTGTYTCTFTAAVTGNANTTHTNTVTACDTTKNPDVCDDGSADVRIIPDPAIEVVKTANPTQLYAPGGPVVFTIVVNNTGGGALDLTSLTDNVFGNITTTGHNSITATTCAVPQSISQGGSYQCQFTATVNGPAGTIHTDIVTGSGTGFNGDSLTDNDDAVVNIIPIPVVNTCPANQATNQWTDILGVGMGTTSSHKLQAKLAIPNSANLVALYGQLAGKQQGAVKYVRFTYPNNQYVQVQPATSPAPRTWGVFWYGTELNPAANIRGRWFLQPTGVKGHVPRAFILYPTYNNPNQQYINVFEVINTADSQVYWNIAEGWIPSRQLIIDIPSPMARATFNVKVAVVDNDKDARPVYVTVSAGGVAQTQSPINPNKGNLLNILSFTLANVPAGTGEIVVTITSPQPNTNGLGALGGDSAAITGVTANYLCEDVQVIP